MFVLSLCHFESFIFGLALIGLVPTAKDPFLHSLIDLAICLSLVFEMVCTKKGTVPIPQMTGKLNYFGSEFPRYNAQFSEAKSLE